MALQDSLKPVVEALRAYYVAAERKYYALMDWLESKRVPVHKYFVDPLESRGIPSFPVFAFLALLLLGLILSLFLQPRAGVLNVSVLAAGEPVEGATVELYSLEGDLLDVGRTAADGRVSFSVAGLAFDEVRVRASFQGVEAERDVSLREGVVDAAVSLRLVLEGVAAPTPAPTLGPVVTPEPPCGDVCFPQATPFPTPVPQFGKLVFRVVNSTGALVPGAVVSLYAESSNALLFSGNAEAGTLTVAELEVDTRFFYTAEAAGYVPFPHDGVRRSDVVRESPFLITITLYSDGEVVDGAALRAGATPITVVEGENATPVFGAGIRVFSFDRVPAWNGTTNASGVAVAALVRDVAYYAVASAPGFFREKSNPFLGGEAASIVLERMTANNTASLLVEVKDDNLQLVRDSAGVAVDLFDRQGDALGDAFNTTTGTASFQNLRRGRSVEARASYRMFEGSSGLVELANASNRAVVVLELNFGTLVFNVTDYFTGAPVAGARVYGEYNSTHRNYVFSCTTGADGACGLESKASIPLSFTVSAPGYFPVSVPARAFVGNETPVDARLVNQSLVNESLVVLQGVYSTSFGTPRAVSQVQRGGAYLARFNVYSAPPAVATGVFVGAVATGADDAWRIVDRFPQTAFFRGSEGYSAQCPEGLSSFSPARNYAWMELSFPGTTQERSVPFLAFGLRARDAGSSTMATLRFRSWVVREGGVKLRNPFDAALGTSNSTRDCGAEAFSVSYPLVEPNTVCNDVACVSVKLEQERRGKCGLGTPDLDCNGFTVASGVGHEGQRVTAAFTITPKIAPKAEADYRLAVSVDPAAPGSLRISRVEYSGGPSGGIAFDATSVSPSISTAFATSEFLSTGKITGKVTFVPASTQSSAPDLRFRFEAPEGSADLRVWVRVVHTFAAPAPILLQGYDCLTSNVVRVHYDERFLPVLGTGVTLSCKNLPLVVDPLFPADGVRFELNPGTCASPFVFRFESADATKECFDFNQQTGVLRYNALRPACPHKPVGNKINGSTATFRIGCARDGDVATHSAVLNITIVNMSTSSSFAAGIVPAETKDPVHVLAVASNMQALLGTRSVTLVRFAGNLPLTGAENAFLVPFSAPGLRVFSYRPVPQTEIRAREGTTVFQPSIASGGAYLRITSGSATQLNTFFNNVVVAAAKSSAFRRSGYATYWCQKTTSPDFNPGVDCKPSFDDWIVRTESCTQTDVACSLPTCVDTYAGGSTLVATARVDGAEVLRESIAQGSASKSFAVDVKGESVTLGFAFSEESASLVITHSSGTLYSGAIEDAPVTVNVPLADGTSAQLAVSLSFLEGFECDSRCVVSTDDDGNQKGTIQNLACSASFTCAGGDSQCVSDAQSYGQTVDANGRFTCDCAAMSSAVGQVVSSCSGRISCENWCDEPNCDRECVNGVKKAELCSPVDVFVNVTNLEQRALLPGAAQEPGGAFPYAWFVSDPSAQPFTYNVLVRPTAACSGETCLKNAGVIVTDSCPNPCALKKWSYLWTCGEDKLGRSCAASSVSGSAWTCGEASFGKECHSSSSCWWWVCSQLKVVCGAELGSAADLGLYKVSFASPDGVNWQKLGAPLTWQPADAWQSPDRCTQTEFIQSQGGGKLSYVKMCGTVVSSVTAKYGACLGVACQKYSGGWRPRAIC